MSRGKTFRQLYMAARTGGGTEGKLCATCGVASLVPRLISRKTDETTVLHGCMVWQERH